MRDARYKEPPRSVLPRNGLGTLSFIGRPALRTIATVRIAMAMAMANRLPRCFGSRDVLLRAVHCRDVDDSVQRCHGARGPGSSGSQTTTGDLVRCLIGLTVAAPRGGAHSRSSRDQGRARRDARSSIYLPIASSA